ncbi:MAG: TonB-dependent receptor [Muribaculaceae bacterium]|nr:TonB-dependent receptor [Muribaculaceae bacterium]
MDRALKHIVTVIVAGVAISSPHLAGARDLERSLEQVEVKARRPLREIGVTLTRIDSAALHMSPAQSMADVLAYNSAIFVKSYGRASLSTVSFRGTSASHTTVSWNGLPVNSPMLGMTDFSTIPSNFVDRADLLHGSSSLSENSGGLGGAIRLSTIAADSESGFSARYTQGVGSYSTFDEYLQLSYGGEKVSTSTRIAVASSANDFHFINRDKKENVLDPDGQIISQYNPRETNRSGAFCDINAMQEVKVDMSNRDRLTFSAWATRSRRELPLLTTDYASIGAFENVRHETTLRAVATWTHIAGSLRTTARGGYIYSSLAYDYSRELSPEVMAQLTRSRSRVQTLLGQVSAEMFSADRRWLFSGGLTLRQHFVKSSDRTATDADMLSTAYNVGQAELSFDASVKWQPVSRLGLSVMLREDLHRDTWSAPIPAFMADYTMTSDRTLSIHASVAHNYHYPSLNDLYFMPGGNPSLKSEHGWSYDAGLSWAKTLSSKLTLSASTTWFDSRINNWILWLPTVKGFFSPRNVKTVHAYGLELNAAAFWLPAPKWQVKVDSHYSWTPSVNVGEPMSPADRSVGRQLPYIPRNSASLTATLGYGPWSLTYQWCHYSRRYTMSSSDITISGSLPSYFMSNIALERKIEIPVADMAVKVLINNMFDEEYLSVLSRPMPGINFEVFLSISPRW